MGLKGKRGGKIDKNASIFQKEGEMGNEWGQYFVSNYYLLKIEYICISLDSARS